MRETTLAETPDDSAPGADAGAGVRAAALWHPRGGRAVGLPLRSVAGTRIGGFLLTVALGTAVSVLLLCTVPLYSALVSDVELQYVIASSPNEAVNLETIATLPSVLPSDERAVEQAIAALGADRLHPFAPTTVTLLSGGNVNFTSINSHPVANVAGNPYADLALSQAEPYAFDYRQAAPYMRLYAGRLPRDVPAGQMHEALATPRLGVHVGDVIGLAQPGVPGATTRVRVVGIWFPKNPNDPFWNYRSYDTTEICSRCQPPVYPLLLTRSGFFNAISTFAAWGNQYSSSLYMVSMHQIALTQRTRITTQNVADVIARIRTFHTGALAEASAFAFPVNLTLSTRLDTILANVQGRLSVLSQPLYMVVGQLDGLALLFLLVVAILLIERRAAAIATLRSRGASRLQLTASFTLLAVVPVVLAGAAGLLLAAQLAIAFILRFSASPGLVSRAYLSAIAVPRGAITPAVAGMLLALAAVVAATWTATRADILVQRAEQGRATKVPFWKRSYLDLGLAVLCIAGYLELGDFGSLSIRSQLGGTTSGADPLQVAAPALLLLAGALIALRLLPALAALGSWIAARGRGATQMLALTQVSRASGRFARLALLLTLVVGVGVFALTFQSSVERNAAERAAYSSGGDVRMQIDASVQGTNYITQFNQHVGHLPGTIAATPILRLAAHTTQDQGSADTGMLGIDPGSFAQVSSWRADFAAQPLASLMRQMRAHGQGQRAGEAAAPLWALVSADFARNLSLKPGDTFTLLPEWGKQGEMVLRVGAIVAAFPTMYTPVQGAGYVIVSEPDLLTALGNYDIGNLPGSGPNEYWLRTTGRPGEAAAREAALRQLDLETLVTDITDRRVLVGQLRQEPITAGIGGLLLIGTALVTLLALLACFVQAALAPRQRGTQLAILRTLGMTGRQLIGLLLTEQMVIYVFGMVGGLLFGLVLSTATLSYLQFGSALDDPTTVGVPPYVLSFNPGGIALLACVLIVGFVIALAIEATSAIRAGLGTALRIGED